MTENFSSATAIRLAVYDENPNWQKISQAVNESTLAELKAAKQNLVDEKFLFRPLVTKILTTSPADLREIYGMREGLEYRLIGAAKSAKTFDELVNLVTERRYPISRVKRLFLYTLMNLTAKKVAELEGGDFVRILAFNDDGRALLKKIRQASTLPIVTKVTKHLNERELFDENILPYKKNLALDVLSTDLREILFSKPQIFRQDFLKILKADR